MLSRFHDNLDPYEATPRLNSEPEDADIPVEHRAIMKYLCKRFSGAGIHGGSRGLGLYPDGWDDRRRYKIDMLLDLDARQIFPKITAFCREIIAKTLVGKPGVQVPESILQELRHLDEGLVYIHYLADDTLSLADVAIFVSVMQLDLVNFDYSQFPYLGAWIKRMQSLAVFQRFNKPFNDYKNYLTGLEKLF